MGIGWSAVLVAASALLVDAVPAPDRARVQGRVDAVMNLGGAAGGAVAGAVVAVASYPALCALAAAPAALVLILAARPGPTGPIGPACPVSGGRAPGGPRSGG